MAVLNLYGLYTLPNVSNYTQLEKKALVVNVLDSLKSYIIKRCNELDWSNLYFNEFHCGNAGGYCIFGSDTTNNYTIRLYSPSVQPLFGLSVDYEFYISFKEKDPPVITLPEGYEPEEQYEVDFEDYNGIKEKYDNFVKNGENNIYQSEKNFWLTYFQNKYSDIQSLYTDEEFERLMDILSDRKVNDKMQEDLKLAQLKNEQTAEKEKLKQNEEIKNNSTETLELEKVKDKTERLSDAVQYEIEEYLKDNDISLEDVKLSYSIENGELKDLTILKFDALSETYQELDTSDIKDNIDNKFSNDEVYVVIPDTSNTSNNQNTSNIDLSSLEIILSNINNSISDNKLDLTDVVSKLQAIASKETSIDLTDIETSLNTIANKEQIDYTDSFQYFEHLAELEGMKAREENRVTREVTQQEQLHGDDGHYPMLKKAGHYEQIQTTLLKDTADIVADSVIYNKRKNETIPLYNNFKDLIKKQYNEETTEFTSDIEKRVFELIKKKTE